MNKTLKSKARFLTLVLRHKPEEVSIKLSKQGGWANVKDILEALDLTSNELDKIVDADTKNRFGYNSKKSKIRANQGHSINIDLELESITPPPILFHGTVEKYIKWIEQEGLVKKSRNHVHLSEDLKTAKQVASRRNSENVILEIDTVSMMKDGYKFYLSENQVWLTDFVPAKYIKF